MLPCRQGIRRLSVGAVRRRGGPGDLCAWPYLGAYRARTFRGLSFGLGIPRRDASPAGATRSMEFVPGRGCIRDVSVLHSPQSPPIRDDLGCPLAPCPISCKGLVAVSVACTAPFTHAPPCVLCWDCLRGRALCNPDVVLHGRFRCLVWNSTRALSMGLTASTILSPAAWGRAIESVWMVSAVADPPRLNRRGFLVTAGVVIAGLALLRVPFFRNLPLGPSALCIGALVPSLFVRGTAYPSRFSVHLVPVAIAMSVCAMALSARELICKFRCTGNASCTDPAAGRA